MAGFAFRLKSKSGQTVVTDLTPHQPISALKKKLTDLTNIPTDCIQALCGFPPKPLDLSNDCALIASCGLKNGDTVIVEGKDASRMSALPSAQQSHGSNSQANPSRVLIKKIVPADNSCLFTSMGFVLSGKVDTSRAPFMRQIIAEVVAADNLNFSEAILGRPNADYCEWIQKPESWGGAIELAVLSNFYGIEIAVIDTLNAIINRFGEDQHYGQRVFLFFDGIHYDPLYTEPIQGGVIETIFPTSNEQLLFEAQEIAQEAKASRQFTDVNHFTLRCMICNTHLTGQVAAQAHARETSHDKFGEIAQ